MESVRRYFDNKTANLPDEPRIDEITWNDLDMDRIFGRINACKTSVGEEYLYNCLREPKFDISELKKREKLIEFFDAHPRERLKAMMILSRLGKRNYNGLPELMFVTERNRLPYPFLYNVLALQPIAAILVSIFVPGISFFVIALSFITNITVYMVTRRRLNTKIPVIEYLITVLRCCKRLCKVKGMESQTEELRKLLSIFKPIMGKLPVSDNPYGNELEQLAMYPKILFLVDERQYNKAIKIFAKHNSEFIGVYNALAEIDLAISVLSFRKSLPGFSAPEFHSDNSIEFEGIFHPLIANPVTNDGVLKKNGLITGSNASGKSTFIKALAVNGILAQTIYTITAKRFKARPSLVVTSMALRDDIEGGESYFIVEVKSLKRILDLIDKYPCACYIDEILRGTNTAERIAASSAVLEHIYKKDCLCVAATHDIELTQVLNEMYANYNFCEQISDEGIVFDYKLRTGPALTRNAIKLLGFMEFDKEIVRRAEELAE
jgi:DNA mismatch repair ATPase MutS